MDSLLQNGGTAAELGSTGRTSWCSPHSHSIPEPALELKGGMRQELHYSTRVPASKCQRRHREVDVSFILFCFVTFR